MVTWDWQMVNISCLPANPITMSTPSYYPSDPYDVSDYDDPDDFAEEWAEEFGDGNYDDAYDYWESEWD